MGPNNKLLIRFLPTIEFKIEVTKLRNRLVGTPVLSSEDPRFKSRTADRLA
jgi:hypothetical protein